VIDDVARLTSAATAAADDRPAEATLLAWAALVTDAAEGIRAVVVEQSGRPPSDFFAVLEQAMPGPMPTPQPSESAEAWLLRCRDGLLSLLPTAIADELSGKLLDRIDLHGIEAPTAEALASYGADRTGGLTAPRFAEAKRLEALEHMEIAQALRVQADVNGAIREAYASDLASAEAYLVESAAATGDTLLVSVIARWALISSAISQMAALPADFTSAVTAVRTTILGALNDADAQRLRTQLAPI
jgi:hypothetical protein